MWSRFAAWFGLKVWPALRPALWTAAFTFLGVFGAALTGWLQSFAEWLTDASSTGDYGNIPDVSVVARAFVSGALAAAAGLVNWAWRQVQLVTGKGDIPTYDTPLDV